jgi:hypothetical protein
MHEREFEASLERMFREAPVMPDAELFALDVRRRLDRGWALRRWGVGAAGVVGGAVAVTQTLGANLNLRFEQASAGSVRAVDTVYREALGQAQTITAGGGLAFGDMGLGMFWVASGVIVLLAVGLMTRAFDEV